jgi:hypothetical protein
MPAPDVGTPVVLTAPGVVAPEVVVPAAASPMASDGGGRSARAAQGDAVTAGRPAASSEGLAGGRRLLLLEDVEVRRSRSRGAVCQVTVSRGGAVFTGESEGPDTDQSRLELTARAALAAVAQAAAGVVRAERIPVLQGVRPIEAFERSFMFVALQARGSRTPVVLTGTSEVRESPEASVVVAVLDATNRWLHPES